MTKLLELTTLITQWAIDRKLDTGNPKQQMRKLGEESGELYSGITKNKQEVVIDSIGDTFVVLVVLSTQLNISTSQIVNELEATHDVNNLSYQHSLDDMCLSLMFQVGALAHSIRHSKNTHSHIMHIMWAMEVLLDLAEQLGLTLTDCVEYSYQEIKDRRGELRNGTFIKEEDL